MTPSHAPLPFLSLMFMIYWISLRAAALAHTLLDIHKATAFFRVDLVTLIMVLNSVLLCVSIQLHCFILVYLRVAQPFFSFVVDFSNGISLMSMDVFDGKSVPCKNVCMAISLLTHAPWVLRLSVLSRSSRRPELQSSSDCSHTKQALPRLLTKHTADVQYQSAVEGQG